MISVLCHLLDHAGERLGYTELRVTFGDVIDALIAAGLLVAAARPEAIVCPKCDDGHELELEWDAERGCYCGHCLKIGFIYPDERQLSCYSIDTDRLLASLRAALAFAKGATRVLVDDRAWFLGTATTNGMMWNAVLLPRLRTMEEQTQLGAAVKLLPQVGLSVALATSTVPLGFERWGLHHLPLADVVELDPDSASILTLRSEQFRSWLEAFEAGRQRPRANNRGQPSMDSKIAEVFRRLVDSGHMSGNKTRDAEAIRRAWKRFHPQDQGAPGASTIRRWAKNSNAYQLLSIDQK